VAALSLESPRALDRLIERGAPGPRPGKPGAARYDVPAIATWRRARAARTRPTLDLCAERAKLARVQRKLTELKLREARGEFIRAKDVASAQRAIAAAAKASLLAVPRRAVLAGLPREHEALVKQLITEALRELAQVQTVAGLNTKGTADEDAAA